MDELACELPRLDRSDVLMFVIIEISEDTLALVVEALRLPSLARPQWMALALEGSGDDGTGAVIERCDPPCMLISAARQALIIGYTFSCSLNIHHQRYLTVLPLRCNPCGSEG
jgi:hypothetical protein